MIANTHHPHHPHHPLQRAHGFSLVEIMVALVIGMISMLVVLQTFSASEGLKRTTTGGDDAQMAGAIGLFDLERDINQAGYGISATGLIGCNVKLLSGTIVPLAPVTINPPAAIVPAGDANTDTLLIAYGNPVGPTEGDLITTAAGVNVYTPQSSGGNYKNDYVIAAPIPPANLPNCSGLILDKISIAPLVGNVTVTTGVAGITPNAYILYDLGQAPTVIGYAVRNGNLTTCNYTAVNCTAAAAWVDIAGNISSLRALYGHDDNPGVMNDIVDTWDQTTPTTTCAWVRTSAVSVVLVARNNEFSTATLTAAAPVWSEPAWSGETVTWGGAAVTSVNLDLSANTGLAAGATWQNYRYKLYSTVAPLHNITWMGQVAGC